MSMAGKLRRAPTRIATGAFILNSGLQKLSGDEETAKGVHGMASGAYPVLGNVQPKAFLRTLGIGETALGGALLLPVFPARLVGAGLIGFSGALLGAWWRTPGMHEGLRPTQQGTAIAKDSWMLGIGTGLLIDSIVSEASESRAVHRAERKAGKQARKAEAKAHADELKQELKAASAERRKSLRAEAKQRAKTMQAEAKAQAKARAKAARAAAIKVSESAAKASESTWEAASNTSGSVRNAAAQAGRSTRSAAESVADKVGV